MNPKKTSTTNTISRDDLYRSRCPEQSFRNLIPKMFESGNHGMSIFTDYVSLREGILTRQHITELISHTFPGKLSDYYWKIERLFREEQFAVQNRSKFKSLTNREKEIISLLLEGYNNRQIAEKLYISRYTVEQHRKNVNRKLSISKLADLYKFGYAFDMI